MKKLLFMVALGVAGLASANQITPDIVVNLSSEDEIQIEAQFIRSCVGVESDCGVGGTWFACSDEESVHHEVADDMRQLLNEAFCGY